MVVLGSSRQICAFFGALLGLSSLHGGNQAQASVRIEDHILFTELTGDGTPDLIIGQAQCLRNAKKSRTIRTPCAAAIDGKKWRLLWKRQLPLAGRFKPLLITGSLIIDTGDPFFTALKSRQGQLLWEFRMDGPMTIAPKAHNNNVVLIAGGTGLYYLDPRKRRTLWTRRLLSAMQLPPVTTEGRIVVSTIEGLEAYRLNGTMAWRRTPISHHAITGKKNLILIGMKSDEESGDTLMAIDADSGQLKWKFTPPLPSWFARKLHIDQDRGYAWGKGVGYAVDLIDGSKVWSHRYGGRASHLDARDDVMMVAFTDDGKLGDRITVYDRESGRPLWTRRQRGYKLHSAELRQGSVIALWQTGNSASRNTRVARMTLKTGIVEFTLNLKDQIRKMYTISKSLMALLGEERIHFLDYLGGRLHSHRPTEITSGGQDRGRDLRYLVYLLPSLLVLLGLGLGIRRRIKHRG